MTAMKEQPSARQIYGTIGPACADVETLEAIVAYNGPMPGAARKECGNFKCLSLADAKAECAAYLPVAAAQPLDFAYPKGADLT